MNPVDQRARAGERTSHIIRAAQHDASDSFACWRRGQPFNLQIAKAVIDKLRMPNFDALTGKRVSVEDRRAR